LEIISCKRPINKLFLSKLQKSLNTEVL